jgi:hypothetical protein
MANTANSCRRLLLLLTGQLAAFFATAAFAQKQCPDADQQWATRCFAGAGAERHIKPGFVRNIRVKKNGYSTISLSDKLEVVAVDRRGRVAVPGIYFSGDFDYPDAENGLGRFEASTKNKFGATVSTCGYFNGKNFKIVIPAIYDHCQPFHDGKALVCKDCERYCTEDECQDSVFIGGNNFILNGNNEVMRQYGPVTLARACGGEAFVRVVRENRATPFLNCLPHPDNPFR